MVELWNQNFDYKIAHPKLSPHFEDGLIAEHLLFELDTFFFCTHGFCFSACPGQKYSRPYSRQDSENGL